MTSLSTRDASLVLETTMRGSLYKAGVVPPDLYKDGLMPFDFRIISPKFTYITTPDIKDIEYVVKDRIKTVPLGVFSITDTDTGVLSMIFELRCATFGRIVDTTVMNLKNVSGIVQPEIMIYTTNNDKIGKFYFYIRARFNIDIPYYIDSNVFTITILH